MLPVNIQVYGSTVESSLSLRNGCNGEEVGSLLSITFDGCVACHRHSLWAVGTGGCSYPPRIQDLQSTETEWNRETGTRPIGLRHLRPLRYAGWLGGVVVSVSDS